MKLYAAAIAALLPCLAASVGDANPNKVIGNPTAPVQVLLFSDFECPACKGFHETMLPTIIKDYVNLGKVAIFSHEFPLPGHKYSREAANYATAAARIGKYREVADTLFRNQVSWSASGKVWDTVAGVLNPAEQKRVQSLAKDPEILAEVQRDFDSAIAHKVNQTPTVIIQRGATVYAFAAPNPSNYLLFRSLVDGLLK